MVSVVISKFKEDVSWAENIEGDLFLYDKSNSKVDGSIPLENKGRESDTYLNHIIRNYEKIQSPCAFLQGNPFDHFEFTLDAISSYKSGVVFLGESLTCDFLGRPHHNGLSVGSAADEIGLKHNSTFNFCAGAQYIVPEGSIKSKPLSWWKKLKDIHDATPSGPWVFERLWPLIFSE